MLSAQSLSYQINEQIILSDISFVVEPGTCLYIRGPNGAGKSSLLKILCGLIKPTSGHVLFEGADIFSDRMLFHEQLAYLGHKKAIKARLTVEEQLFSSDLLLIKNMGLSSILKKQAYELSAGQQQRLTLARLINQGKKVWVLDEPFTALDVAAIAEFSRTIEQHCQEGGCVILSSHQPLNLNQTAVSSVTLSAEECA